MAVELGILGGGSRREYEAEYDVMKSYITGSEIVTPDNDDNLAPLRKQFLVDNLVNTLYTTDLKLTMKRLPVVKVGSTIVEFSRMDVIGEAGDGFVAETGSDGAFGINSGDDAYSRHTRTVKFMAAQRTVGDVAKEVKAIQGAVELAKNGATLELIRNANIATLWGHSGLNNLSFDGIEKQIWDYVLETADAEILIDMADASIGLEEIKLGATICMERWGQPSILIQSVGAHHATEQTVWSQARYDMRNQGGMVASNWEEVDTLAGKIKLATDIMLRENRPAIFSGPGSVGRPCETADDNSWTLAVDPISTAAADADISPSTQPYYKYRTTNDLSTAPATAPALPSSLGRRNNAGNRLNAGNWYYLIEPVFAGKRGVYWAFGAASVGTLTSADAITTIDGQIVKLTFKTAATAFAGVSNIASLVNQVHYRIYRNKTTLVSPPTSLDQFGLLGTTSFAADGTCIFYDNGMFIPGTTTSFMLTEKKDGRASVVFGEFMDMYQKQLAPLPMGQPYGWFLFGTPIVFYGGHHVIYYNVKASLSV